MWWFFRWPWMEVNMTYIILYTQDLKWDFALRFLDMPKLFPQSFHGHSGPFDPCRCRRANGLWPCGGWTSQECFWTEPWCWLFCLIFDVVFFRYTFLKKMHKRFRTERKGRGAKNMAKTQYRHNIANIFMHIYNIYVVFLVAEIPLWRRVVFLGTSIESWSFRSQSDHEDRKEKPWHVSSGKKIPSQKTHQQKDLQVHPGRLTWNLQITHLKKG